MPSDRPIGRVLAIAIRSAEGGPMREFECANARRDAALEGHGPVDPSRGITLLSARQWKDVVMELGRDIPWHTRRANVLLDADGLLPLVGATIRIGEVNIEICDETRPCRIMERQAAGLREILKKDGRGGVHGRILNDGKIRVGDAACLLAATSESHEPVPGA